MTLEHLTPSAVKREGVSFSLLVYSFAMGLVATNLQESEIIFALNH